MSLDMEYPRLGLIRVDSFDAALLELRASMGTFLISVTPAQILQPSPPSGVPTMRQCQEHHAQSSQAIVTT